MKNILITSAGQRVSLVRAFQKELRSFDSSGKVYTVDLNPILAPACHVSDGYASICRITDESYVIDLIDHCKQLEIGMIIPTIDTELLVLAQSREAFIDEGIIPIVSDLDFVKICRDKRLSNEFFQDKNIDIPQPVDKHNPTFPLFIKPYDGSLSKDTFIIKDQIDLSDYHYSNPKLMFMEYMDQQIYDEYTVDTYYGQDGQLKCAVPRKRIFVRAGEINKGVTQKNEILNYLIEKLPKINGARGCLTMQFFLHTQTKRIVAVEINPRFGGGFPLSYLAGANYPKHLIDEYMMGEEINYYDGWEANLLMLRYDDEILVRNYEN